MTIACAPEHGRPILDEGTALIVIQLEVILEVVIAGGLLVFFLGAKGQIARLQLLCHLRLARREGVGSRRVCLVAGKVVLLGHGVTALFEHLCKHLVDLSCLAFDLLLPLTVRLELAGEDI